MIKPLQAGTNTLPRGLSSPTVNAHPPVFAKTQHALVRTASLLETGSERSGSTANQWLAYANEGVKADDAQAWQNKRKEAAKIQELISVGTSVSRSPPPGKLIQISPKKRISNIPSPNTNLLVDLVDDSASASAPSTPVKAGRKVYKEKFSYVGKTTSPIAEEQDREGATEVNEQGTFSTVPNLMD